MSGIKPHWIAVDWGTSNLRLWLMREGNQILDARQSNDGMGSLTPEQFEPALMKLIHDVPRDDQTLKVICCGMVGAAQGWQEAAYAQAPCAPPGPNQAIIVKTNDPWLDVRILPGVKQLLPADVMRGEETQIRGFLASEPHFKGCLCLPGTHTKWVSVAHGQITHFQTVMTGELFDLLAHRSVLRHAFLDDEMDDAVFLDAVQAAVSEPASLTSELFRIRAQSLVTQTHTLSAMGRLSGLLIGSELAGTRQYWLDQVIRLIGDDKLSHLYAQALRALGAEPETVDAGTLTLHGLIAAFEETKI